MTKKSYKLKEAILETANDMLDCGIISVKEHEKITLRHLKKGKIPKIDPITNVEIKNLREEAHLSQAAFASYLNLTVGYVSQLERGVKEPTGAVLALFNIIRRRGVDI